MKNVEYWRRRVATAAHEAQDADRVWRQAMQRHESDASAAESLLVLWQERDRANARVTVLQGYVAAAEHRHQRRERRARRRRRSTAAFVVWHLRVHWQQ